MPKVRWQGVVLGVALAGVGVAARAEGERLAWFTEAKAVFEGQCNVCHPLERALSKTFDRETWAATVERMHSNGAEVDGQQRRQVVDYLFTKNLFEGKCSACHGVDRPLGKSKPPGDWLATVKRMGEKKPGHLSDAEIQDIAAYLAVVRPAQP